MSRASHPSATGMILCLDCGRDVYESSLDGVRFSFVCVCGWRDGDREVKNSILGTRHGESDATVALALVLLTVAAVVGAGLGLIIYRLTS